MMDGTPARLEMLISMSEVSQFYARRILRDTLPPRPQRHCRQRGDRHHQQCAHHADNIPVLGQAGRKGRHELPIEAGEPAHGEVDE